MLALRWVHQKIVERNPKLLQRTRTYLATAMRHSAHLRTHHSKRLCKVKFLPVCSAASQLHAHWQVTYLTITVQGTNWIILSVNGKRNASLMRCKLMAPFCAERRPLQREESEAQLLGDQATTSDYGRDSTKALSSHCQDVHAAATEWNGGIRALKAGREVSSLGVKLLLQVLEK